MDSVFTLGRSIILFGNLIYSVGAFIADWSITHVLNPNWPPHAKFHNGQTMSLGVCLAAASTYFAFRPALAASTISAKESVFHAAVIGSFYCFAGLTAILYPGTDWTDPEFAEPPAQMFLFPAVIAVIWIGYALEVNRLGKAKTA